MERLKSMQLLTKHKEVLCDCFGVISLALFGSTVRNTALGNSDVGILVDFDGPATSERYFGVQFYPEGLKSFWMNPTFTQKADPPHLGRSICSKF